MSTNIDKIRSFAATTQAIYDRTLASIKAAHDARLAAREDLRDELYVETKYLFNQWRRADVEKVYRDFKDALVSAINRQLALEGAGISIESSELPCMEMPQYRNSTISCLDQFHLVELEAAAKADFVAAVDAIACKLTPEAIGKRARHDAIEATRDALQMRWTRRGANIREVDQGMAFEMSSRNDGGRDAAICTDTARRINDLADALAKLIGTETTDYGVQQINLYAVAREVETLRRTQTTRRVKIQISPDAVLRVFKDRTELEVSLPLFALISDAIAVTAPASEAA